MGKSTLALAFLLIPLALPAQVYRCDTAEGTVYSQMPCADNAERLAEYDPEVEDSVDQPGSGPDGNETGGPVVEDPPDPMETFIATLEKQREEQIGTLDATIRVVRAQLNGKGDKAPDEATRKKLEERLSTLNSERNSITEQYASLISEASTRTNSGPSSR